MNTSMLLGFIIDLIILASIIKSMGFICMQAVIIEQKLDRINFTGDIQLY